MAIGFLNRGTDYSQVDRFRGQLMDAVNRQIGYESKITEAEKAAGIQRAVGSILTDYAGEIQPKQVPGAPAQTVNVPSPTIFNPGSSGSPMMIPGTAMPMDLPTGAVTNTPMQVEAGQPSVEEPSREQQYNAAMKAFARLSQYGKPGLDVAAHISKNLDTYAKMFPYRDPVHSEALLGTIPLKSSLGDEANIAQFGYIDEKTKQPVVTGHSVVNFGFPPGYGKSGKGDPFYGGVFTYNDPVHPELASGLNEDLTQDDRIKVDNQLASEQTRIEGLLNTHETHRENMVSQNAQTFNGLPVPYSKGEIAKREKAINDLNGELAAVKRKREVVRGTWKVGKSGGELDRGAGIKTGKGAGH
jgi:hypothetical protein